MSENADRVKGIAREIGERFKSGDLPDMIARTRIFPDCPCRHWSLRNQILTMLAGTSDARGYRQWEKVGRHVKKGSKAFYILAPATFAKKRKETGDTGEEVEIATMVQYFRAVPVFRAEDTEGDALPAPTVPEPPPLAEVAERFGYAVEHRALPSHVLGQCDHTGKTIAIDCEQVPVFFHELAHAAHEQIEPKQCGGQDPYRETVAELAAVAIAATYGMRWEANSRQYIAAYNGEKNVVRACLKALTIVDKVLDLIFGEKATRTATKAA